jgi:glucose-1-phosphate thymidylyltransferase
MLSSQYIRAMKGIVLAGGTGSRLWPITKGISKQLVPVYDKPLIHYPLGTLFLAGIREILIITTPEDQIAFQRLLGDGSQYGVQFTYAIQNQPNGLAEAFIIGEKFINSSPVALVLGDNIFHGVGLGQQLSSINSELGATIFAYKVSDPERYGVVEFNAAGKVISIEEKPQKPKSNYAVPGLYFYDAQVCNVAKEIKPSARGELEITAINDYYLANGQLTVKTLDRGTVWLDSGTIQAMHAAASYVQIIEERQGNKISCLEEISWRNNWISNHELLNLARNYGTNSYGSYLNDLLQ